MFESQYMLEELGRQKIDTLRKEAEEERLRRLVEPEKKEIYRTLPYALTLASIVIAIVII